MAAYTSQEKVESVLGRELTEEEQALLPGVIEMVSRFVNDYTQRSWDNIDQ